MSFFTCSLCKYSSPSKYNYNRHVILKHSESPPKYKCDYCDCTYTSEYFLKKHKQRYCSKIPSSQFVTESPQFVTESPQFVTENPQFVTENPQFVTESPQFVTESPQFVTESPQFVTSNNLTIYRNPNACPKCNIVFSRKDNLTRHLKICKEIENSLECPKCHVKFNCRMAKSRHMKLCAALIVRPSSNTLTEPVSLSTINPQAIVNNSTNNSGVINNNNIINNQPVQNINYITFTMDRRERINFNTEHFTPDVIENIIKSSKTTDEYSMNKDIISGMADHLFTAIKNRCVRKKNCRATYSEIHIGENKWEQRHDSEIYDKFLTDMTEVFIELVNRNKATINVSKHFIKQLDDFLNLMADKGYCGEDDTEKCYSILQSYKELLKRLKIKVLNY